MLDKFDWIIKNRGNFIKCLKSNVLEIVEWVNSIVFMLTSDEVEICIESEWVKFLDWLDWLNLSEEERLKIKELHIDWSFISLMNNNFDCDNGIDDSNINDSILKFIKRRSNELLNLQKELNDKEKNLIAYAYKQGYLNWKEHELNQLFWNLDNFLKEYYIETFSVDLMEF